MAAKLNSGGAGPLPGVGSDSSKDAQLAKSQKQRFRFVRNLTSLFGFRRSGGNKGTFAKHNVDFVKVDPDSDMRIAQGKLGKTFTTKLSSRLETLFDAWLTDTTDTFTGYQDRLKRLAELQFAITNDPFLSMAVDLYADEGTQLDVQGQLINIDCSDPRMKTRMENLLRQWGVTQNRVRSAMYNMAWSGDAFWSNKVTRDGVIRINPLDVHQVTERLEFDPVQVASKIALNNNIVAALSRDSKLQMLFSRLNDEENDEYADLFDKKLFGFVTDGDLVLPPWCVSHFRLNSEQSEFYPMGKSIFLKALAPFRQYNATKTLQSIARVMSYPITVYSVKTTPGMDESQQFEKINEAREQYENIGEQGNSSEAYSVNTKMWVPDGLVNVSVHSPNIDVNAIGDLEMYRDDVAIASGIPKGYLVNEWGNFGVSAISLVEQFKPFARRVYTLQSAFIDGLSNLFRLHFAITGEFDYTEPFVLSMKFPNEESSDERVQSKTNSLSLSKDVIDTVSGIIGAINDPLPQEVVQDILTKFSFLDPKDIKKWVKKRNLDNTEAADDLGGDESGTGGGGGISSIGGGSGGSADDFGAYGDSGGDDFGEPSEVEGEGLEGDNEDKEFEGGDEFGTEIGGGGFGAVEGGEENAGAGEELAAGEDETGNEEGEEEEEPRAKEEITRWKKNRLREARVRELTVRYVESREIVQEAIMQKWLDLEEATINNRHYKYSEIPSNMRDVYETLKAAKGGLTPEKKKGLQESVQIIMEKQNPKTKPDKLNFGDIKSTFEQDQIDADTAEDLSDEDLLHRQKTQQLLQ